MIRAGAIALLLLTATQAAALSCRRPDPVQLCTQARDSTDSFVAIYGTLDLTGVAIPKSKERRTQALTFSNVPMRGLSLTTDGFSQPFDRTISLRLTCAGPWCGRPPRPGNLIAFLQKTAAGYVLEIGPCGGWAYPTDDPADLDRVTECHRGGACQLREN